MRDEKIYIYREQNQMLAVFLTNKHIILRTEKKNFYSLMAWFKKRWFWRHN